MEIVMHRYKEMDLKGATLINGFSSTGLMNTIVASYLVSALNLDQICGLDSDAFPPISMVYDAKPKFPARIYADERAKVVVFLSEFTPVPQIARDIARTILSYALDEGCTRIISPETLIVEDDGFELFGIGSIDETREELERLEIKPLMQTMIPGISGVLLNEGKINNMNVMVPVAKRGIDISDARTAAHVIEIIDRLIPTIEIDLKPLYTEAEGVERYIKKLRQEAKPDEQPHKPAEDLYGMYR